MFRTSRRAKTADVFQYGKHGQIFVKQKIPLPLPLSRPVGITNITCCKCFQKALATRKSSKSWPVFFQLHHYSLLIIKEGNYFSLFKVDGGNPCNTIILTIFLCDKQTKSSILLLPWRAKSKFMSACLPWPDGRQPDSERQRKGRIDMRGISESFWKLQGAQSVGLPANFN